MNYELKIKKNNDTKNERDKSVHNSLFLIFDLQRSRGFSLLETLVALAILTVTMLGPMTLAFSSIRSSSLSHSNIMASFLAEEAMEIIRARRDANVYGGSAWLSVIEDCTVDSPCIADVFDSGAQVINKTGCSGTSCPVIKYDEATGLYQYSSGRDTQFVRTVWAEPVGAGNKEARIKVRVTWEERFLPDPSVLDLEANLFNWK